MWHAPVIPMFLPLAASTGWTAGAVLAWLAGLGCGIVVMVALSTDWQRLPTYLRLLARSAARNASWALLAAASFGVLVFY